MLGISGYAVLCVTPAGKIESFVFAGKGDKYSIVSGIPSEVHAGIVVDLVAGQYTAAAILNDGSCYTWGGDYYHDGYNQPSEFNTGDDCGIASLIGGAFSYNLGALYGDGRLVYFGCGLDNCR